MSGSDSLILTYHSLDDSGSVLHVALILDDGLYNFHACGADLLLIPLSAATVMAASNWWRATRSVATTPPSAGSPR